MTEPGTLPAHGPGAFAIAWAWAGAAIFVASLATFGYAYGVRYGAVGTGGWLKPALIDAGLFTTFALHHSILSRAGAKHWVLRLLPPWLERSAFTWIASVLLIAVLMLWRPVPGVVYSIGAPWSWIGYAAQLAGVWLTAVGSSALDVLDLAGVRPVLDARDRVPPRHVPLKTDGVYGLVRHPLYFGWVLMVFGAPHMTGTRAVFALVSTAYLVIAIPFEERSLVAVFGDAYAAYRGRTRFRILPGIW